MKTPLRSTLAAALIAAFSVTLSHAAEPSPGYADFGKLNPSTGEQFVEVDVGGAMLKLASAFAKHEEPAVAELIAKLERVRVNVLGLSDENRTETTERINAVRADLDRQDWKRLVTVREKNGDDVVIFIKESGADSIHGVVVTVISAKGEAVFVNVVGDIAIEQLAKLGERLNIDPLRKLNLGEVEQG